MSVLASALFGFNIYLGRDAQSNKQQKSSTLRGARGAAKAR